MPIYRDFGLEGVRTKLSTRTEDALRTALDQAGHPYTIFEGKGVFYGPKLEYVLRDATGRDWQCGTLQVDFNLTERFGTIYVAPSGDKLAPVQAVVATVTDAADDWATEVAGVWKAAGIRVETDLRNEKIGYKVREHALHKIPVQIVLGGGRGRRA